MSAGRADRRRSLFTWPSDAAAPPRARCDDCGTLTFPAAVRLPALRLRGDVDASELADRGTLFTFTTQSFLPKEPYTGPETEETFTGYALGYVELPGEVMVETRLTEARSRRSWRIGMPMQLVVVPFRRDPTAPRS